jgi:arylsulfatase A-like enzyme
MPADRTIDGRNIWPLLTGEADAKSPHESFYCYYDGELRAVRDRQWKLHLPHEYRTLDGRDGGTGGTPAKYSQVRIGEELFDLKNDPGETTNVADKHPEIVERLREMADEARKDLGDTLTKTNGANKRPPGRIQRAPAQ